MVVAKGFGAHESGSILNRIKPILNSLPVAVSAVPPGSAILQVRLSDSRQFLQFPISGFPVKRAMYRA